MGASSVDMDSDSTALPTPQNGEQQESLANQRRLTVTFDDVDVQVHGLGEDFGATCWSVVTGLLPSRESKDSLRHILQGIHGQVRPGEMLLVLGRPGSGCTSLLKILANMRDEFVNVDGAVRYGNISAKEAKRFRDQIVMNTEEDVHFPTLKVAEVMEFASRAKVPKTKKDDESISEGEFIEKTTHSVLESLGIKHTSDTKVGDEFIRGVSGGERKRVSLAEVMATQGTLQCWDNSTRGLDASNALDFARVLRGLANNQQKSVVATLYQAGNGIYDQFDKVLVLVEGRQAFYGPAAEAKAYFEDMGFQCAPGANIADFLTSVAVETEREVRPGFEGRVPNTAEEFEARYASSELCREMKRRQAAVSEAELAAEVEALDAQRALLKNRSLHFLSRTHSVYQVSFGQQVLACTKRQFQVLWGDRWTNALKLASNVIVALLAGSIFYNMKRTSDSLFLRSSAMFFPILYFGLNCLSEVTASFQGRPIFSRHKRFGFSRPAAQAIACTITDIPFTVVGVTVFELVLYFMAGFQHDAAKFFTQWFIYIMHTLCLMSFYRMLGAWCSHFGIASQIAGCCTMVLMVYAGYLVPVPKMHVWFRWISYIDPITYAFSAVMGSETGSLDLECVEPQFVPYGPQYTNDKFRGCVSAGSKPGTPNFSGSSYLNAQYGDPTQHVWRNVGIIIAFWIFFALLAALGFEMNLQRGAGSTVLFDKDAQRRQQAQSATRDVEKGPGETPGGESPAQFNESKSTTFTFRDISYFVHHAGAEKQLLQDVSGFVKPGKLVALMGSSGAGKTTLMDVLAQRKDNGRVEGSIKVNGKPQDISFQRTTGYCQQDDLHEPTATVREALLFSARLRQSYEVPDAEKVAYVDHIMELLELIPLQHALIGTPGSGLSIEQRKRLTIATELVAKPSLLFLDEPTSGLDGQSAYEICRFLQKLSATGQTIICTIHQPSAVLFEAFDVLLLLAKGGRTTYFGPTGNRSNIVLDYFAQRGAPCPADSNPAEHIVDVVQGRFGTETDWPQQWNDSGEKQKSMEELAALEHVESPNNESDSPQEIKDFATPLSYQIVLVTTRQLISLWRNPDYVWNKMGLHVINALFGGFTFWKIGTGTFDLQTRLMSVFNFLFVAPGCINQLQPLFIRNRDIFETREKKSKTYRWLAFISGQLISEIPVLIVCATLFFVCWYFTSGFPVQASISGQVYLQMIFYEFLYTSIGQSIAAYSPNALFAALANPLIIGTLIQFCGVVAPYYYIPPFWRYWFYYLNPFNYLVGGLLTQVVYDVKVECLKNELITIPLPSNTTCGEYMHDFLSNNAGHVINVENTTSCSYCQYSTGADYLKTLNINAKYYGWRDVGITALFCISSYALVFLMMKLRTKATKTAK